MRIAHTCLRYPPATGGVETYVHEIVERTRDIDAGRDVRVLTSNMRTHGPITELDPNLMLDDPLYVQRLHHVATPFISYPRLQALKYYLGHHKPDIIHGYSFWYQPADVAARYAQKNKLPFIFHPIYYENKNRQKLMWQTYKRTIGQRTFAAADVVVVISPFEQELITKAGFPVKRFELIPPGIHSRDYEMKRPNPFAVKKITGTILLIAGRVAPGKGIEDGINVLPELIKAHPDIQLVIAGENFGAKKSLKQRSEQRGVTAHVHWLGRLNQEELIGAFQHADILIHPSRYEAFGIVLAEAAACGTAIIARNTAAIPFVIPHQQAGLLFSSPEELKTHIVTLLTHPSLRAQYGHAARHHVSTNFSWEKSVGKITQLYDEFSRK